MVNTKRKWKPKRKGKKNARGKSKRNFRSQKRFKTNTNTHHKKNPCAYGHVYSTECGHCINMQKDWDKLTEDVKKENNETELIDISQNHQEKVDAMNNRYKTDLKFMGFPTIFKLSIPKTNVQYYQGDRSSEDMKRWLFS